MEGQAEGRNLVGRRGLWLTAADFVSTDACAACDLGLLGFPRAWPKVYYESQVLRSLLGKKGSCPAGRVAVVGQAEVTKYSAEFTKALLPWQGRHNAEAVQRTAGLQVPSEQCGRDESSRVEHL
ncbi:Hypothetical protein (Fragment) [Durusdinium trenchii]|uniref:Uncharacterized protein n=1 Tax=Durusdinium trenchii TaxID=1381693 RepID=A0ABP0N5H9_9DINO